MDNTIPSPMMYTVDEAVATTKIKRSSLYQLIRSNQLPVVKVGRRTLIRHSDLTAMIDRLANPGAA